MDSGLSWEWHNRGPLSSLTTPIARSQQAMVKVAFKFEEDALPAAFNWLPSHPASLPL